MDRDTDVYRRAFLALLGAAGSGCAGVGGENTTTTEAGPFAVGETVRYQGVIIEANTIVVLDSVEYRTLPEGVTETWDPGEGKRIVVVQYRAENPTSEQKEFPEWSNFILETPEGTVSPRPETPDGTSVEYLQSPIIDRSQISGVGPASYENFRAEWGSVYVAPTPEQYAIRWERPDGETIRWVPE